MESFWSIKCKRKINSTPEKLWNLISKPGYLNLVHPYCKESTIKSWKKNDHSDILIYLNGLKYERHFNKWKEKKGYSLMIGKKNGKKSHVKWKISSYNNETFLTIIVSPYLLSNWPKLISFIPYLLYIKPNLKKYLNSVIGGIDWYLINNKPIPKNYFGKHLWFS
tara:strand:+ start:2324 stop:2818 length:495 start_codon:yes stop_codon:yes gene_type:complete